MPSRTRKRVKTNPKARKNIAPERPQTNFRTMTDLPPEILHMIFCELHQCTLWGHNISMRPATLISRNIRDVAVEYLHFTNPTIISADEFNHFMRFMQNHPRASKNVRVLRLYAAILDTTRVNEMKQLFPNMADLVLENIVCNPTPNSGDPGQPSASPKANSPFHLESVNIACTRASTGWSLSGMMHILSLLEPKELLVTIEHGGYTKDTFDPRCVVGLSSVVDLEVRFDDPKSKKSISGLLDALSTTLNPETLQSVEVQYDSRETVRALGTMLKRVGQNVTKLKVHAHKLSVRNWVDPFDDWRLLDLRPCKKLAYLGLSIHLLPKENISKALSHVGVGLLANHTPRESLQKVVLNVYDLPRPTTLGNRSILKLQAFDNLLKDGCFSHLQEFVLDVAVTRRLYDAFYYVRSCSDAALRALPGLQSLGFLKVLVHG